MRTGFVLRGMKNRWLPHLFYGSVLLTAGLFYADKIGQAERVNRLLAEPISATIQAIKELNRDRINQVEEQYRAYINPENLQFWQHAEAADSLTQLALFNLKNRGKSKCEEVENLKNAWFKLVANEDKVHFNQIFRDNFINNPDCPARKNSVFEVAGNQYEDFISSKADSLLFSTSESWMLNYYLNKVSGSSNGEFYAEPWFTLTNLHPAVGDTVQAELFLGTGTGWQIRNAEVNGSPIKFMEYGKAYLKKRFDHPGLWPIHARFQFSANRLDSLVSCERTFFIRVKN